MCSRWTFRSSSRFCLRLILPFGIQRPCSQASKSTCRQARSAWRWSGARPGVTLPGFPYKRFGYRQLMYYVVVKAVVTAVKGYRVGWGKLERRATVAMKHTP